LNSINRPEQEAAEFALDQPVLRPNPYAALRYRDFRLLLIGRFVSSLGEQMLTLAIGWELYARTGNAFYLGLVGLVQIVPVFMLSLPAGHWADKYNRRAITLGAELLFFLSAASIAFLTFRSGGTTLSETCAPNCDILTILSANGGTLGFIYLFLFLIGVARSLSSPASSSLLPQTCPPEIYGNAVTWSSTSWQAAAVIGPALSGLMIAIFKNAGPVFIVSTATSAIFAVLLTMLHLRPRESIAVPTSAIESLREGLAFVRRTRIILAAITLDMFAVLLGGATALLPVFQKDILHVDEVGLGLLRLAPSVGALLMSFVIANRPPFQRAGRTLLIAVIGFGVATIVFGLSRSFILSLLMLATLGALDNISVVIRSGLVLLRTPDAMRGRISAVNSIFIGTSNELGSFESGATASLFGPVASVVGGGVGTILVVIGVALLWPELRQLGTLAAPDTSPPPQPAGSSLTPTLLPPGG